MKFHKLILILFMIITNLSFYANAEKNFFPIKLITQVDGINYIIFEGYDGAYVCNKENGYEGNIIIPENVVIESSPYPVMGILDRTFSENNKLIGIEINCKIKSISKCQFYHCRNLERVKLPDSLSYIGEKAFYLCYKLNNIIIPDSVLSIYNQAFEECYNLNQINLPSNLKYLGKNSFSKCYNLKSISFPDSLERVREGTFKKCVNLENLYIPNNLIKIGKRSFYKCSNLRAPVFPDTLTFIGDKAFSECYNIEYLIFPSKIKHIGWDAFEYCTNLDWIRFLGDVPPKIGESAFYFSRAFKGEKIDVFVPDKSINKYKRNFLFKFGHIGTNVITYSYE